MHASIISRFYYILNTICTQVEQSQQRSLVHHRSCVPRQYQRGVRDHRGGVHHLEVQRIPSCRLSHTLGIARLGDLGSTAEKVSRCICACADELTVSQMVT